MFPILAFFLLGIERFLYGKFYESKVIIGLVMYFRERRNISNIWKTHQTRDVFIFLACMTHIKVMFITLVLTLRLRSKLAFLDPLCKKKRCIGKVL